MYQYHHRHYRPRLHVSSTHRLISSVRLYLATDRVASDDLFCRPIVGDNFFTENFQQKNSGQGKA